ncbi:hypothetical protein [Chitinophaga lutea]|uniref:hypothetical protein n=1 Tax=Chitinophaga lutea TaxID=2488634 RepID=UPI000F4D94ED|nr:hypothetical protein [Chitinophaga lutea]
MATPVSLPVVLQSKPAEELPLLAFAFDQKGQLVEKVPVVKGKADFKTLSAPAGEYRFLIAPAHEKTENADSLQLLQDMKAYEPVLEFDAKGAIRMLPIPDNYIRLWPFRKCRVKGKLIKAFTVHGVTEDKPVCRARVHICEVDKITWLLPRIPDYIIEKIPEYILHPDLPIPLPEPDPIGPIINPQRFNAAIRPVVADRLFNPGSLPGTTIRKQKAGAPEIRMEESKAALRISPEIRASLTSRNISAIRKTLLDNIQLFHPIFCKIPFLWPYLYRCDEIKTVYTDNFGRFDTEISYFVFGDKPDLYFWVEYLIDGVWTTVYRPAIACHTWWDYICGTEVTLRLTDPRVPWRCGSILYGSTIWIKTIGESTNVSRIKQADTTAFTVHGHAYREQGLTDVALPNSPNRFGGYRRPFGGGITIRVQFSFDLPKAGLKYYRWSARKVKNADMSAASGSWMTLANPVAKGYAYSYLVGAVIKPDGYASYPLGPVTVGTTQHLFIIPPVEASTIATAGQLFPWWSTGQDTFCVNFDSNAMQGDGLYELKMELFDKDGHLVAVEPTVYQMPHKDTFTPIINAPSENLVLNGAGKAVAFKMLMRFDNNEAEGEIYKIKTDPESDGMYVDASPDCCGFVPYNSGADTAHQVRLTFRAYQPHNFADFVLNVIKGTCGDTLASDSAMVIGSTAKYTRNFQSVFLHDYSPKELLGECALKMVDGAWVEGKAAFAELLHVQPLAVNGTSQVFGNVNTAAAFALEPA